MCGLSLFLNLRSGGDSLIEKTALCSYPVLLAAGNEDLWGVPETVWWKPRNAENGSSVLLPFQPILFSFSSSPFSPFLACLLLSQFFSFIFAKVLNSAFRSILVHHLLLLFLPLSPSISLEYKFALLTGCKCVCEGFCSQMLLWEVSTD